VCLFLKQTWGEGGGSIRYGITLTPRLLIMSYDESHDASVDWLEK